MKGQATTETTERAQTSCHGNRCRGEQGQDTSEQLDADQLCDIVGGTSEGRQTDHHHVRHTGMTAATTNMTTAFNSLSLSLSLSLS